MVFEVKDIKCRGNLVTTIFSRDMLQISIPVYRGYSVTNVELLAVNTVSNWKTGRNGDGEEGIEEDCGKGT